MAACNSPGVENAGSCLMSLDPETQKLQTFVEETQGFPGQFSAFATVWRDA